MHCAASQPVASPRVSRPDRRYCPQTAAFLRAAWSLRFLNWRRETRSGVKFSGPNLENSLFRERAPRDWFDIALCGRCTKLRIWGQEFESLRARHYLRSEALARFAARIAEFVSISFSNLAIALAASLPVLARYLSRIRCAVRSECPAMLAISGTAHPASASIVTVAPRRL